jgi:hypothetical protein
VTCEQPVEQDAEGIHVRGRLDAVVGEPFRGHVGGGAEQLTARLGRATDPGGGGDAEVDDLGAAGGDDDVGRFDVAVHQPDRVRGGQCGGDLRSETQHLRDGQRPDLLDGRPVDQLHHDVRGLPTVVDGLADVVDLGDVRVGQCRGHPGLVVDPVACLLAGGGRAGQDLDRDQPVEHLVVAAPDHGRPAAADLLQDPVAAAEHPPRLHTASVPPIDADRHVRDRTDTCLDGTASVSTAAR